MLQLKKRFRRKSLLRNLRIFTLAVGVIMVWRGVWNLIDHYLFPDYWVASSIASIIIGIIVLFLSDEDLSELAGDE